MKEKLRPTVWRTARALDNENRLRFLRAVFISKEAKGVTRLAEDIGVSVSTASQYLRALNARGLVDVKRESSYVYYGSGKNRSLPEAQLLQDAFRRLFERKDLPSDWPARISPVLKAYASTQGTHATILPVAYWLANAPSGHSHCRNPKTPNKPLLNNS